MTQAATQKVDRIAFARLTKIDESKRLVYGRAAQEVKDRSGEIFDYETSKPLFQKWSESQRQASLGKSAGNVRAMHKDIAAGILTPDEGIVFNDAERAIDICTHVTDDQEWAKVESGTYTGFSIGGRYAKKWTDGEGNPRYTGEPSEISLVDRPCGPTSNFFEVHKADGTTENREFTGFDVKLMAGGKDTGIMVKSAKLPQVGEEFEHEGQAFLLHKIEDDTAEVEFVYNVQGTPEELGAFAKTLADQGLTIAQATELLGKRAAPPEKEEVIEVSDADTFAKAAQMAFDEEKIGLADFAKLDDEKRKPWLEKARAELTKVDATKLVEKLAKGYGSATFADPANRRWPVDTREQVQAALKFWGMKKSRSSYSAEEQEKIGAAIHAAADRMGISKDDAAKLEGMFGKAMEERRGAVSLALAKLAKADATAGTEETDAQAAAALEHTFLRKGLVTCASFAYAINSLCQIAEACEMEAAMEGDGSDLCNRIYALIAELGEALKDMVDEEIKEEVDGDEVSVAPAMAMSQALAGLAKRAEPLMKAMGTSHMQKLHDRTLTKGAVCNGSPAAGGDITVTAANGAANPSPDVATLKMVIPGLTDEGANMLSKLFSQQATLQKAAPADGDEVTTLRKTVGDLQARLAKVEKQPMPARIHARVVPTGVTKEQDGSRTNADPAMEKAAQIAAGIEPVMDNMGKIDEAATAVKIMQKLGGRRVNP